MAISGGSTLDIANNILAINYGSPINDSVRTIAAYLASRYNSGSWTGTGGIVSTTAQSPVGPALSVGYADGNTDIGTAAAPNQVLVKYTLAGDANLDGLVNFQDLVAVIQNFNKDGADWAHGNFTYGASTNFQDLVAVVQNFNKTLAPAGSSGETDGGFAMLLAPGAMLANGASPLVQPTDVQLPEPGSIGLAALAGAGFLARRRRKMS